MKKFFICVFLIGALALICVFGFNSNETSLTTEYLRVHIRANSNLVVDQNIKYTIKDSVVEFLTPYLSVCNTKALAQNTLKNNLIKIECIANEILAQHNFNYKSKAYLNSEYFPIRAYDDVVLPSGIYDALIIELGDAQGDNWWCVVYPPLCFVDTTTPNIIYKSRILEIIQNFFS